MPNKELSPRGTRSNVPSRRFDERLGPLSCVVVVLTICVAGLILNHGDFNTAGIAENALRLAASGWVQLAGLLLIAVALMWQARHSRDKARVRRMQFSACLGLLMHLGMLVGLQSADSFLATRDAEKKSLKRRPFEIVSLPSDGKQLTKRIFEQGLARPVETDSGDERNPFEWPMQEPVDPVANLAPPVPPDEPTPEPAEIVSAEIARAEASAARPGELAAARIEREALTNRLPSSELMPEAAAPVATTATPQPDAQISDQKRQPEPSIDSGRGLSNSPETVASSPRSNAARRDAGENNLPAMANAPSPARLLAQGPGRLPTPTIPLPSAASTPSPSPQNLEPINTNVRGAAGGQSGRPGAAGPGGDRLGSEFGLSRPAAGTEVRAARRTEGSGLSGNLPGRPVATTPYSRRSQIVVEAGSGGGTANEPGVASLGDGSGDRLGNPRGEMDAAIGVMRRGSGGLPGGGAGGGSGVGAGGDLAPGTGGGVGNGIGSITGRGSGGAGTATKGPVIAGPARSGPQPGGVAHRGSIRKSDAVGLPGNVDGAAEGTISGTGSGARLRTTGSESSGAGGSSGPQESAGGPGGGRRPAALPGSLANSTEPGIGGLGSGASTSLGLPSTRARTQSDAVSGGGGRFILDKANTGLAIDSRADPAPAFRQRGRAGRGRLAEGLGGNAESERAVELGLKFLAGLQSADGHWGLHNYASGRPGLEQSGEGSMEANTAGTGLALLAFLGAGYSHYDEPHGKTVDAGLHYLVRNQKPNGDLFTGGTTNVWFYSHGIASIAMCEAYGMTRDPNLREPAQKALNFILSAQHPVFGGWRYSPRSATDTSVSGWQMMALKSGELAGLTVPRAAYTGVSKWLDTAQAPNDPSRYSYLPTSQLAHQREPNRAMTAEGLLMRLYLGWDRSNPHLEQGADFLRQNLPQWGRRDAPYRDAYYWYYATQVMFQMQGEYWQDWNGRLRPMLVDSQVQAGILAGSWDPHGPVPDRWGDAGGRIYVTAMNLLMLEVYYRHLPLYQTLTDGDPTQ